MRAFIDLLFISLCTSWLLWSCVTSYSDCFTVAVVGASHSAPSRVVLGNLHDEASFLFAVTWLLPLSHQGDSDGWNLAAATVAVAAVAVLVISTFIRTWRPHRKEVTSRWRWELWECCRCTLLSWYLACLIVLFHKTTSLDDFYT